MGKTSHVTARERAGWVIRVMQLLSAPPFFIMGWPCGDAETEVVLRSIIFVFSCFSGAACYFEDAPQRIFFRASMLTNTAFACFVAMNWCFGNGLLLLFIALVIVYQYVGLVLAVKSHIMIHLVFTAMSSTSSYICGNSLFVNGPRRLLDHGDNEDFVLAFLTTAVVIVVGMVVFGLWNCRRDKRRVQPEEKRDNRFSALLQTVNARLCKAPKKIFSEDGSQDFADAPALPSSISKQILWCLTTQMLLIGQAEEEALELSNIPQSPRPDVIGRPAGSDSATQDRRAESHPSVEMAPNEEAEAEVAASEEAVVDSGVDDEAIFLTDVDLLLGSLSCSASRSSDLEEDPFSSW